ncbi:MAG: methylmalonyl Co-A mutase-associated GTPase MeaB [Magnetococcales bacterium]|nr:methylmalonyl Co-A mutase-associated GTPase MeaB [Magnetococcales bacterium]
MKRLDLQAFITGVQSCDRRTVAKAITLVESTNSNDRALAQELLVSLGGAKRQKNSYRIGISGPPGAGKSTFIESLSLHLLSMKKRVAILAVDPTSKRSGGSILGDKTRMGRLVGNPDIFIRPSPNGETLGGVTRKTRETIVILEAAGFDTILVETVGVGQSETAVAGMVDFFTLLHLPGAGDDLQGIKRGIMEVADIIVINKADGQFLAAAKQAEQGLKAALSLLGAADKGWESKILLVSSLNNTGIPECWDCMWKFYQQMNENGNLQNKRKEQNVNWMWTLLTEELHDRFNNHPGVQEHLEDLKKAVSNETVTPVKAAATLMDAFAQNLNPE